MARELTAARFDERARRVREAAHPESMVARATAARRERSVWFEVGVDGMATLHHHLPVADALAIDDLIDRVARSLRPTPDASRTDATGVSLPGTSASAESESVAGDDAGGEPAARASTAGAAGAEGDDRTHGQRRCDVLTDIVLGRGERPRVTPTVIVTVPAATVAALSDEPGDLHGYGPIDPATARAIAATAPTFLRALIAPGEQTPAESVETPDADARPTNAAILSVTRRRYRPTTELRTVLLVDDETCRFPGCGRRASRCELDHTTAWAEGGETRASNLAHLCARHHHLKHEGGWRAEQPESGVRDLLWTSPRGARYLTRAPRSLRRRRPPNPGDDPPRGDDAPPRIVPRPAYLDGHSPPF